MFATLSYKQKNRLLLAGAIVFLIAAYALAFRNTIRVMGENKLFGRQVELARTAPAQIEALNRKVAFLDEKFDLLQNRENFRNSLLSQAGDVCKEFNLVLKSFGEPVIFSDHNVVIENYRVELQGGYINLVKAIDQLENQLAGGRMVSARFYLEYDRRSKKEYLAVSIVVQTINKNKEDADSK